MEEVRLGELKKYVPFMDYILTLDYQYKDKFAKIRKWIIANKKFSKEFFDKIEKSIIVTYKDIGRHEGFPIGLHKIFTVDLCSDDESDIYISTTAKKINQQKTPAVLRLQHVTISDNENDDDVEIVCVTKSNVVDLTKDKKSPKKRFERSTSDLDINEEIFKRINATNSTRNESPQDITPPPDGPFAAESDDVEDRLIFKRRKDFTEKENTFSELNNNFVAVENDVVVEQNPSDEIRLKAKKKKKKHKKEKNRRHDKNRKKIFKVTKNIVIDSSTDDESAISNSSKTAETQVETTLNGINNLDEKELLKIKSRIINEIHSDATEANKLKEIEKEKCNENLRNIMSDNSSNKELDETELLQMKDNLMKTIGVNINTEELLEILNLSNLNDKSSSPTNTYVGRSIPTLISNTNFSASTEFEMNQCTSSNIPAADPNSELKKLLHPPKVTESSTQPISNVYKTIPTIENHYPHPRHSFSAHQIQRPVNPQTHLPNVNIPVPIQTMLPMPQPKNIPSYVNTTNMSSIPFNYQHSNLITIATTTTMPKATHFNIPTQLTNEINYGCAETTFSIRQPLLLPPPPHPSQRSAAQSFHPAVVQQPHLPPLHHQIRHQLQPSAPPQLHPAVSHQPHLPVVQPLYPTVPQPLHGPAPQPLLPPALQPLHAPAPQPLHAPAPQPLHPPAPQPLHPPAPQPLHPPVPSRLPAFNAQHSAMLSTTSAPMPSQLSQRPQLAVKDPRLRRMQEQGQYGNNRQSIHNWESTPIPDEAHVRQHPPSTVAQPVSSTTKSRITYGEYVREVQRKKQLDAEMKQQKEAEERAEKQRKLEENQRKMQIEKEQEQEKMEHLRQTESIKQILSKHSIVDILTEMINKKQNDDQNQKNVSENSERNGKKDKPHQDAGDRLNLMERQKSCLNSTSRALKELECTVKGFNRMQDFILGSSNGKRRSSVSARKAIASLLTPLSETVHEIPNSNESNSPSKNKKRRVSMESIDDEIEQVKRLRKDLELRVQKAKRIPNMKKCKVVIHRLSSSEIDRYMKKHEKMNNQKPHKNAESVTTITTTSTTSTTSTTTTLMKEKTPSPKKFSLLERTSPKSTNDAKRKSQEKTYARKSTEPFMDIKNIDCAMTERNCDKCVLCISRSANLTNHYIRVHKRESYLSRLTWEELDDLQMKVPFAEEVRSSVNKSSGANQKVQRFKVECPFCPEKEREVVGSFAILRQHYSMHTGEYAYQCKGCGQQKPFRKDIADHQKRTRCNGMGLQTLYLYPTDLMVIYMYVCNICNFVQLNEENVFKHLREQHGKLNRDAKLVKQFTLAAIKDGPLERVPVGNFAEIIPSMENFFDSELFNQEDNANIVVGNEPLLDESYSNIFKPEPLDEDNEFAWDTRVLQMQPTAKRDQEEGGTEMAASKNVNLSIFLETSGVDIKPEISTIDQSLLENARRLAPLTDDVEETTREEDAKPDVELLTVEAIKALLRKYSSNTGIRPDLLYQCPRPDCRGYYSNFNLWSCHMSKHHNSILSTCPHCKSKKNVGGNIPELPIADFEQHFKTHCMRLYVCFHCDTQCVDESELRAHAKQGHADIEEVRIECIPISCSYAYHVLIDKNVLVVRLEFLLELCTILRARIQHMEEFSEELDSLVSQWTISNNPAWLDELSIPIFHPSASNPKCMFPSCLHSFANPLDLVEHWKEKHNTYKDHLFSCRLCGTSSPSKTFATLGKHNFMHAENIFACCVCSYMTYDRKLLSKHIYAEHDKRDVCALTLKRSKSVIKVKIEFVFGTGSKTFSTTNSCFCGCGAKNLRVDTYVSHLKREHLLKLHYFCEHCGERLMQLQSSDEHFLLKHAAETGLGAKIRCQLACSNDREVNILSIRPLQIRLSDEDYEIFQNGFGSPKKALVIPETVIKSENNDNEADEPIIMDDDEIVAENEAKRAHSPQKTMNEGSKISVKNNWKLF